jgi:hypothetical protein
MWQTQHTHDTPAAPEHVLALWADVENWPAWDASLIATTLDGPTGPGSRIVVTIEAEGPDADTIDPAVASDLPESVAALAAAAEARALPA